MDVEAEQIIRDLRRRAVPGDPSYRAADYIEKAYTDYRDKVNRGETVPPAAAQVTSGLNTILESTQRAQQQILRQQAPEQDTTTRDMLTKETLALLRQEREHELGNTEEKNDYEYIQLIENIFAGRFKYVSQLILLTSRYAGELPHELIHPFTRQKIQSRLAQSDYATENIRVKEVESELTESCAWQDLVDPGLAGNARIACDEIAQTLPRLRGLNINHVIEFVRNVNDDEHKQTFLDFFCAVTAFAWRYNSVMAAQPYKTKYEHEAVQKGLRDAALRLKNFALENGAVLYAPRQPPKTLQELRGKGNVFI